MNLYFSIILKYLSGKSWRYDRILLSSFFFLLKMPFVLIDKVIFGLRLSRFESNKQPVFVLGYYRSGTTFLQQLIALNPEFGYLNFYKTFFPKSFLISEWYLKPFLNKFFSLFKIKHRIQRIDFDWDLPGEEDVAFTFMPSKMSLNWLHAFPSKYKEVYKQNILLQSSKAKANFKKDYLYLYRRLSYAHKGKRLVLKSPPNTARIPLLLNMFPNAKFVYIERDEQSTILSNRFLWSEVSKFSYESVERAMTDQIILELRQVIAEKFEDSIKPLKSYQIAKIKYEDLAENPSKEIRKAFDKLQITFTHVHERKIIQYEKINKGKGIGKHIVDKDLDEKIDTFRSTWKGYD